jgi:hypothetical protein
MLRGSTGQPTAASCARSLRTFSSADSLPLHATGRSCPSHPTLRVRRPAFAGRLLKRPSVPPFFEVLCSFPLDVGGSSNCCIPQARYAGPESQRLTSRPHAKEGGIGRCVGTGDHRTGPSWEAPGRETREDQSVPGRSERLVPQRHRGPPSDVLSWTRSVVFNRSEPCGTVTRPLDPQDLHRVSSDWR